jgi:hypothetical protein
LPSRLRTLRPSRVPAKGAGAINDSIKRMRA